MPIPSPEPGLVLSYSYVWEHESRKGRDEGGKDRPCILALAVRRQQTGETVVTVLPVTHRAPVDRAASGEIPAAVKRHLGLDYDRSWVIVSEGDQFVWLGYDLRRVPDSDRYDYGFLPPRFFQIVLTAFRDWHRDNKVRIVARDG